MLSWIQPHSLCLRLEVRATVVGIGPLTHLLATMSILVGLKWAELARFLVFLGPEPVLRSLAGFIDFSEQPHVLDLDMMGLCITLFSAPPPPQPRRAASCWQARAGTLRRAWAASPAWAVGVAWASGGFAPMRPPLRGGGRLLPPCAHGGGALRSGSDGRASARAARRLCASLSHQLRKKDSVMGKAFPVFKSHGF